LEATLAHVKVSAKIVETILEARRTGQSKNACAHTAGISRLTLDRWLRSSERGEFDVRGHERFHLEFVDAMSAYRTADKEIAMGRFPAGALTV
jgi:hypothetical protein